MNSQRRQGEGENIGDVGEDFPAVVDVVLEGTALMLEEIARPYDTGHACDVGTSAPADTRSTITGPRWPCSG